jgi:hypothetical protein
MPKPPLDQSGMASPDNVDKGGTPQPIVKVGHYTLGATLGIGTFGKVKSINWLRSCLKIYFKIFIQNSWRASGDQAQSGRQNPQQTKNQEFVGGGKNSSRNPKPQALQAPTHH